MNEGAVPYPPTRALGVIRYIDWMEFEANFGFRVECPVCHDWTAPGTTWAVWDDDAGYREGHRSCLEPA